MKQTSTDAANTLKPWQIILRKLAKKLPHADELKLAQKRKELCNNLVQLDELLEKVEFYQPLYGITLNKHQQPQRGCADRADVIYEKMRHWGTGGHLLDIGCSLGYFSNYFAERGYYVSGIDSNENNVAVCKQLQTLTPNQIDFSVAELSFEYLDNIPDHLYDSALLLSVAHHIVYYKGLEYTQDLMVKLLDKIPVLFVELAIKDEDTNSNWRDSLPNDELAIFAKCQDINIEKLGLFSNHLSSTRRPLYMVSKKTLQLLDQPQLILNRKFTAYDGANYVGRKYYDCGDRFIKKYLLAQICDFNVHQIKREIDVYKILPPNEYLPQLLDYQIKDQYIAVSLSKLPGKNVHDLLIQGQKLPIAKIFSDLIASLNFLLTQGLYHNDVRLWNLLWDGQKAYLIDLGFTASEESENTNLALLWMIHQLHQFNYYDFKHPIEKAPVFDLDRLQPGFPAIVKALQEMDFKDFSQWFAENKAQLFDLR